MDGPVQQRGECPVHEPVPGDQWLLLELPRNNGDAEVRLRCGCPSVHMAFVDDFEVNGVERLPKPRLNLRLDGHETRTLSSQ